MTFTLRTLLVVLLVICILLCGIAAAWRAREESRDAASHEELREDYGGGRIGPSIGQPGGGDAYMQHWARLLGSPRGRAFIRELDALSPFVAFDDAEDAVYYVTEPWLMRPLPEAWGRPRRLARVTLREGGSVLRVYFVQGPFEPELTVEHARALFADPQFAARE